MYTQIIKVNLHWFVISQASTEVKMDYSGALKKENV